MNYLKFSPFFYVMTMQLENLTDFADLNQRQY